ncbi:hypothetical protein ABZ313_29625 [Streptomyces sp. NPDC006251]
MSLKEALLCTAAMTGDEDGDGGDGQEGNPPTGDSDDGRDYTRSC